MIKLIIVVAFIILIALLIRFLTPEYDKCYSEMEYEGYASMGCCCGLAGGTSATEYLSESCIECPHLVLGCNPKDKREEEK